MTQNSTGTGPPAAAPPRRQPGRRWWRRWAPRSFRGKIVVSTVALMIVAMVLVGLGIQLLLAFTAERDITQVVDTRAATEISAIQRASARRLTVPANTLDPGVVVFDGEGRLVAGSVEREARPDAADLSRVTTEQARSGPDGDERLLGVPFTTPSGEHGVIVVSQQTAAYERSEFYAVIATGALGFLVVVVTALIALRVTRQALAPVAQMAERAAEWSERDLGHRFDLGPPTNELAALGDTLDHLLGRVASAILSEQRLTSELAHELRTPLTSVLASADLALMRGDADPETHEDLEEIAASAREMSAVITTLLALARTDTGRTDTGRTDTGRTDTAIGGAGSCTPQEVVSRLLRPLLEGVPVEVRGDTVTARIAAPCELVVRAIAPVLDNAVKHARNGLVVEVRDHAATVEITISDDGPGVPAELLDSVFTPGVTGDASAGAGLGLGIARRVARSLGGDVRVLPGAGGASFSVSLPRR